MDKDARDARTMTDHSGACDKRGDELTAALTSLIFVGRVQISSFHESTEQAVTLPC